MKKPSLPVARLREMVAAELRRFDGSADAGVESISIHVTSSGWVATFASTGQRLDERTCAAVREAGLRLSASYDVSVQ